MWILWLLFGFCAFVLIAIMRARDRAWGRYSRRRDADAEDDCTGDD